MKVARKAVRSKRKRVSVVHEVEKLIRELRMGRKVTEDLDHRLDTVDKNVDNLVKTLLHEISRAIIHILGTPNSELRKEFARFAELLEERKEMLPPTHDTEAIAHFAKTLVGRIRRDQ